MAEAGFEDVRRRILASLEEMESARPARRWHGAPFEWTHRNHHVALGVVDLLDGMARALGQSRVRAFAEPYTPGGTPLVLQPTNPEAAELTVLVDWFDDVVQLYAGGRGRVEMYPARRESAASFLPKVASYLNAIVSGGFRVTYSSRTPPGEAKLEFFIDGTWRRSGGLMIRGVRHGAITKRFDPY